jgi:DNA mismatch endonuclease (patch repair protein)
LTDVVSRKTRSRMMAGIKGMNTAPERLVRRYLHAAGLRFRLHDNRLPGRPDIVLARYRTVVLVHGCFWHMHPGCRYARMPASRTGFWQSKLEANVQRDRRDVAALSVLGWKVLIIWECEAKEPSCLDHLFWSIVAESPSFVPGKSRSERNDNRTSVPR